MTENHKIDHDWFDSLDAIVAEPLKFKMKLAIGEDAYTTLKVKKRLGEIWDIIGAASTGGAILNSSVVASTFFPSSGFLAMIGIGTAVTPIGWVVAGTVLSGGAWYGVTQFIEMHSKEKVKVIPEFINTPIDVLGLMLFDLMAPLALKVAAVDGHIHENEMAYIKRYLIDEWGYDKDFIEKGVVFTEIRLSHFSIKEQAKALAKFQKENRDCNFEAMASELNLFLSNVMEADAIIDEREEMAIDRVNQAFSEARKFRFSDVFSFLPFQKKRKKDINIEANLTAKGGILDKRLSNATPEELVRLRQALTLDMNTDEPEIINTYRYAVGNTLANFARKFGVMENLSYKEILVALLESLRPVGEDIQIYKDKIISIFTLKKNDPVLDDDTDEQKIIEGLEQALLDKLESWKSEIQKPPRFGYELAATVEIIMIGRRQKTELKSI
jgi:uncharacterized tellurite resistance protein B-like protein